MSAWPPPPEVVVGGALSIAGWLIVRLWNRLVGRVDALERDAVRRDDQKERDDRLERSVASLQASVNEGFKDTRTAHERLAAEIQRQSERQAARTSELIAAAHNKMEGIDARLREEIADVRRSRAAGGD